MKKLVPKTVNELQRTPYNPRKPWTDSQSQSFLHSLAEFGDLSGIVFNTRTGHLVGGNKRTDAFEQAKQREIEIVSDKPDKQGSVRHGYVVADGNRFAYREVNWEEAKEKAANIAANRWGAEWDDGALVAMLKELDGKCNLELTGFDMHELDDLLKQQHFDASALPDSPGHQEIAPQSFIIYLTFSSRENMIAAMMALTGGVRNSLPEGAKFAHIDGEGPANAKGTERIIEALGKMKV